MSFSPCNQLYKSMHMEAKVCMHCTFRKEEKEVVYILASYMHGNCGVCKFCLDMPVLGDLGCIK